MTETLSSLLTGLELIERAIDSADEITLEMCEEHFSAIKEVDQKVDRLLRFIDTCKMNAAQLEVRAKELSELAKKWERKQENLEAYALYLVKKFPDTKFRGTDRQMRVKLNPVKMVCEFTDKKSFSNVISEEFTGIIPAEFLEEKTVKVLRSKELKDSLKAGNTVTFAKLERDEVLEIVPKLKE